MTCFGSANFRDLSEPVRGPERELKGRGRHRSSEFPGRGYTRGRARRGVGPGDFEALYAKHARYIAGVVHRLMGHDGELDDIVQETFVDAIDGLSRLRDPRRSAHGSSPSRSVVRAASSRAGDVA